MKQKIYLLFLVSILVLIIDNAVAVEQFSVEYSSDTTFLRYYFSEIRHNERVSSAYLNNSPAHYFELNIDSLQKNLLVFFNNPQYNSDILTQITSSDLEHTEAFDDRPVRGKITDVQQYFNKQENHASFVFVGDYNDSAYVYEYLPGGREMRKLYLATGKDKTGDGVWNPSTMIILVEDYDFDGRTEAFIYTSCGRDFPERKLFCVELETMRLEWSLPMASVLMQLSFFSVRDSLSPAVVFLTSNPSNGARDTLFDDRYKYLVKVGQEGQILYKKIVCDDYTSILMRRGTSDSIFYVGHTIQLSDSEKSGELPDTCIYLSIVDRNLSCLKTRIVPLGSDFNVIQNYKNGDMELLQITKMHQLIFYTEELQEIRQSGTTNLFYYMGEIKIKGEKYPARLFFSDDGLELYSTEYKKLAHFSSFRPTKFTPVKTDASGNVTNLLFTAANQYSLVTIEQRKWNDLVKIYLWKHRNKVYIALTALVIALLMMTFNRFKTKKNLLLIKNQKEELESTYQALQDTQKKLIETERYKQAQEISAGFAHEIRNALFPVSMAVKKIKRQNQTGEIAAFVDIIQTAFHNSLALVDKFITYTNIEHIPKMEQIDVVMIIKKIIDYNYELLRNVNVTENYQVDRGFVTCNSDQFQLVINNIIINAVEALKESPAPALEISVKKDNALIVITFKDNGCGIADAEVSKVFNPFYSTKLSKGSGFGLSYSKKIVEMSGGTISLSSITDKTTTISVSLPASQTPE